MLVEMAIGDAYGAGFEYAPDSTVREKNNLYSYVQHQLHRGLSPGRYTDDTQMAIGIAELLVDGLSTSWRPRNIAAKFLEVYHRDERDGYASAFKQFLDRTTDPDEFLKNIRPNSNKSGGAMRAPPIGVLRSTDEVIQKATIQAQLTHNTREGVDAACASALLSHYCVHQIGPKAEAGKFIERLLGGQWSVPWDAPVGSPGWQSTRAAITAVVSSDKLSDVLKKSIAFTGDVDTVGAIAMAAAAHSSEIENDLKFFPVLEAKLENGPYGKDFLSELDAKLMALAG